MAPPVVSPQPVSGTLLTFDEPGQAVLLTSVARTATPSSPVFAPGRHRIVTVTIKTSAAGSSPSTVPTIEVYDAASDSWIVVLTGVAITATGTVELSVGPNAVAATNLAANTSLAPYMRVTMTHGNGTTHTYTVGVRAS